MRKGHLAHSEFKPCPQGLRDQGTGAVRSSEQAIPNSGDAVVYSITKFAWYTSPQAANQAPNTSQSPQYVNYSRGSSEHRSLGGLKH
jgi:hypothetical protein